MLAHGWWFSPVSSTTKTRRHDIAEILLKVALKHQNQIKSKYMYTTRCIYTAPKKKYVIFVVLLIQKNTRTQHNSKYIKHMYTIIRTKLHIHLYIIHSTRNTWHYSLNMIYHLPYRVVGPCRLSLSVNVSILQDSCKILIYSRFCYSSFLGISLVLTWNMILFEAKYHF